MCAHAMGEHLYVYSMYVHVCVCVYSMYVHVCVCVYSMYVHVRVCVCARDNYP